jgi:hypothetical protein
MTLYCALGALSQEKGSMNDDTSLSWYIASQVAAETQKKYAAVLSTQLGSPTVLLASSNQARAHYSFYRLVAPIIATLRKAGVHRWEIFWFIAGTAGKWFIDHFYDWLYAHLRSLF